MKLQDKYTTSALMHLLKRRYGLNPLGIKQLLRLNTRRYNQLLKGEMDLIMDESLRLVEAFPELAGRFAHHVVIVKDK